MAGHKETPRQKMIGMMYLVLTALLALNVSKDILNAFVIVNDGLKTSQVNTSNKNDLIYSNFQKASMNNPTKVKPFLDNALKAQKYSQDLSKFISELKTKVIAYTEYGITDEKSNPELWKEADTKSLAEVDSKDNYDKPMHILIGETEDGSKGEALVLKNKFEQYKKDMLALIDDQKDKAALDKSFPIKTEDVDDKSEGKLSWINHNFHHTVLAADVAIFNKFLVDVKTVEGDVISKLYSAVDAGDFKFDQVVAKVVPKSSYVLLGSDYEADIFVAAYDSKLTPDVSVWEGLDSIIGKPAGEGTKVPGEAGLSKYKVPASGVGEKKFAGIIYLKAPSGGVKEYPFHSSYTVGQPSATISADKMNVFYIGVDNPVTISVPGVPSNNVLPSITAGGSLTPGQGAGKYIVRVNSGISEATVNVSAKISGKVQTMGATKFRVKRVPDPVAYIGGVKSGIINKNVLAASHMIVAKMENFDFELTFIVTSYVFSIAQRGGDIIPTNGSGNMLTNEMVAKISRAAPGTRAYIEEIKAVGPDKVPRTLAPIILKLQ